MTSIVAVPASALFAFGWLFGDPTSVPLWQIGLALPLAGVGVFWIYVHESWRHGKYIDAQFVPSAAAAGCAALFRARSERRAGTYSAFMTQAHPLSGIPMPSLSYLAQESARNSRARTKRLSGAVMKDHSQRDSGNPYSPLMSILLLLVAGIVVKIGAATQLCHLVQSSCQLALN